MIQPKHVVVINDISQPKGGATALALASALALRARGFKVTYICGDAGENVALKSAGVDIVALGQNRLTSTSRIRAFAAGLSNPTTVTMVQKWISEHDRPDTVYHIHGWSQILSPSLFRAVSSIQSRLIVSAHDFFLACPNGSFALLQTGQVCPYRPLSAACISTNCDRRTYAHKLWRVARQMILRHNYPATSAPLILVIHEAMKPFLLRAKISPDSITTLRNPVTAFTKDRIKAEGNRDILYVGRLEATKGPDLAAEAARRAGARIIFVGDGVLRQSLAERYPEMLFLGHQPPEQIAHYARKARFLVMPSRYPEPFGLVAVEALWSGLPVILTDTALLTPEIEAAGAGMGTDVRDVAGFSRVIKRLMDSDELSMRMSEAEFTKLPEIALRPEKWVDGLIASYASRVSRTAPHSVMALGVG